MKHEQRERSPLVFEFLHKARHAAGLPVGRCSCFPVSRRRTEGGVVDFVQLLEQRVQPATRRDVGAEVDPGQAMVVVTKHDLAGLVAQGSFADLDGVVQPCGGKAQAIARFLRNHRKIKEKTPGRGRS